MCSEKNERKRHIPDNGMQLLVSYIFISVMHSAALLMACAVCEAKMFVEVFCVIRSYCIWLSYHIKFQYFYLKKTLQ